MSPARRRRSATLAALVLAAALTGCTSSGSDTGGRQGFVTGEGGGIVVLSPEQRGEPVALAGTTLQGQPLDMASLRGRVVVLNAWGSWCKPCRQEAPDLQASATALEPRDVEFVGINVRDPSPAPALAFERTFKIEYPSLHDEGGRALLALRGAIPPNAIPSTVVLDREGRVAARITGRTTKATLTAVVEDVLSGAGRA